MHRSLRSSCYLVPVVCRTHTARLHLWYTYLTYSTLIHDWICPLGFIMCLRQCGDNDDGLTGPSRENLLLLWKIVFTSFHSCCGVITPPLMPVGTLSSLQDM